ncbi:MAG TPA: molecular chaperone TorD family protein [Acidimicrobiia bacterium]
MTTRATGEERALARAALYRLLSLTFAYPGGEVGTDLKQAVEVALVAGPIIDPQVGKWVGRVEDRLAENLEAQYQRVFTLSYSAECPLYETAFSARHLFQQTQQQADIAGFYRAFGVTGHHERPDHLAAELEFGYLLALKEARARTNREHRLVCRDGQRSFLRAHLGRWAPLIAQRVVVVGAGTMYESAARLLLAFLAWEQGYLRLGRVELYRDEPMLIADEPGDLTCPLAESVVEGILDRIEEERRVAEV